MGVRQLHAFLFSCRGPWGRMIDVGATLHDCCTRATSLLEFLSSLGQASALTLVSADRMAMRRP